MAVHRQRNHQPYHLFSGQPTATDTCRLYRALDPLVRKMLSQPTYRGAVSDATRSLAVLDQLSLCLPLLAQQVRWLAVVTPLSLR